MRIFLYGPPGSGKSAVGRALAENLNIAFTDLDQKIEQQAGCSIREIFAASGEADFRRLEILALIDSIETSSSVIALGGGTLLNAQCREMALGSGTVICLSASLQVLLERINHEPGSRPLLAGEQESSLEKLLVSRRDHYESFGRMVDAGSLTPSEAAWAVQVQTGTFYVRGMGHGYEVAVRDAQLADIGGEIKKRGLKGPLVVVSDEHVGRIYSEPVIKSLEKAGYKVLYICVAPGESSKNIQTVNHLWEMFVNAELERSSTVLALGGGVVGDMVGFAAATYMRGVKWVVLPTSLLAMVDSSLGGKTAIDLARGKNLVGAFHAPALVWADPLVLRTLPDSELRNGMAEVVKHGVIGDPELFEMCAAGRDAVKDNLGEIVRRAIAVKIKIIMEDPYEMGMRQALNLGHTIGHGVESASSFRLLHGEAVSIGMVAAAKIAEEEGYTQKGLVDRLEQVLQGLGLPVEIPDNLDPQLIIKAMILDKKRVNGSLRFALPVKLGEVRVGIQVDGVEKYLKRS